MTRDLSGWCLSISNATISTTLASDPDKPNHRLASGKTHAVKKSAAPETKNIFYSTKIIKGCS